MDYDVPASVGSEAVAEAVAEDDGGVFQGMAGSS